MQWRFLFYKVWVETQCFVSLFNKLSLYPIRIKM